MVSFPNAAIHHLRTQAVSIFFILYDFLFLSVGFYIKSTVWSAQIACLKAPVVYVRD
jgi:hypothetical protein